MGLVMACQRAGIFSRDACLKKFAIHDIILSAHLHHCLNLTSVCGHCSIMWQEGISKRVVDGHSQTQSQALK